LKFQISLASSQIPMKIGILKNIGHLKKCINCTRIHHLKLEKMIKEKN
jgi:hypothetical protein